MPEVLEKQFLEQADCPCLRKYENLHTPEVLTAESVETLSIYFPTSLEFDLGNFRN